MKRIAFTVAAIFSIGLVVFAQPPAITKASLAQAEIDRIVKTTADNEAKFREALTSYVFDRSASISTIGMGGQISGTYRRDSFMTFTTDGKRFEKIVFAPVPTLTEITITPEDIEDLSGVNPFALEPRYIPLYNFTFLGTEKIDDLDLYVFEVGPRVMPDPKSGQRVFVGRIWIDQRDLMIVKSKGKGAPETKKNKFPVVESWRENVDGKYWFPSFATSDDEIVFDNGNVVKMRVRVKYQNYRVGRTDVIVVDGDEDVPAEPQPSPTPTPQKP